MNFIDFNVRLVLVFWSFVYFGLTANVKQNALDSDQINQLREEIKALKKDVKCNSWQMKLDHSVRRIGEACTMMKRSDHAPKGTFAIPHLETAAPFDRNTSPNLMGWNFIEHMKNVRHYLSHDILQKDESELAQLIQLIEDCHQHAIECEQEEAFFKIFPDGTKALEAYHKNENFLGVNGGKSSTEKIRIKPKKTNAKKSVPESRKPQDSIDILCEHMSKYFFLPS